MLRWNKYPLTSFISSHIIDYPTPLNLNYMWSFGSAAGICLVIQIVTGIFLAMFYTAHIDYAFLSVEYIMRNVNNGWIIRYLHANGASIFFIVVYCHIFRGLYFGSYIKPRAALWMSGVVIFILMMATAFIGYVLPWGQMSFWGVTVITNLFSAIPFVGKSIVEWLWGGFSVGNATLNRFFSFHYLFPFLIAGVTIVHLALLHNDGSNNPIGVDSKVNKIPFYPYFYVKDLLAFFLLLWLFSFLIFYYPNLLGHPDNYIPADSMKTPAHIVPEWYFLPFYAILRAIPHKLGGVLAMGGSLIILFFLPFIHASKIRSSTFRLGYRVVFWLILTTFLLLMWLGPKPTDHPYVTIGQILTFAYFFLFLVGIPLSGIVDSYLVSYKTTK
jgi:ubiquinol-cytochrome c reductase cytochrome b subunit